MPRTLACLVVSLIVVPLGFAGEKDKKSAAEKVSYYKQIRPIFQANCQGCHQPAKSRGDFVMTAHDKLLSAGESGKKAIVPGKASESYLVESIVPVKGKARMPEGKPPLDVGDIDLVKKWIDEGATDDTPANARQKFDADHPPVYTYPPILPSLDYSPDGKFLAAAGFHEVLLVDTATDKLAGRLIGLSERIQSVRFSPDGKLLAVAGGLPGRMGEIQVWDVAKKKLKLSAPITADTLLGLSWSADGNRLAFGCTDNSVRVIDAKSGEQIMFQGGHADWVLDTFFTVDDKNVVSASRDMSVKLTEIATQRLIDNVTSITPGALKGGVQALGRHPKFNIFVAGGSDGMPRAYRVFRETTRMIGDDANLIADLFPQMGRIFGVRFSADGKKIASASSLDGRGEIVVASFDYDADVPDNVKKIMGKVPGTRTPAERKTLDDYRTKGIRELSRIKLDKAGCYAVAFHPDNTTLATAAGDGLVRLYDSATGKLIKEFAPAPIQAAAKKDADLALTFVKDAPLEAEKLLVGAKIVALEVEPKVITLNSPYQYVQLSIIARLENGDAFDATRIAKVTSSKFVQANESIDLVTVTPSGLVRPRSDGVGEVMIVVGEKAEKLVVTVRGMGVPYTADFVHDVNPVLGRLGCNAGTCHGANKGKNGFKLSLRGSDPILDVRAFLDDHAGRRANIASPDDSLMLLKPSAGVPHVGGQVTKPGEPYYELIRNWIAHGAKLKNDTPRVTKIAIQPAMPIVQRIGEKQQFRVLATYADGKVKDVTREAFVEAGNIELASADNTGLVTALRRGEVPILARYDGAYIATTMLVMGDRAGFVWKDPPAYNRIDELTAAKWKRMKIQPSELSTDLEFLRRVYLDLTGLPPTADDVRAFTADARESKLKREAVVDKLIGSPEYVDFATNKWADLLTVNRKYLGAEGAALFRAWIRKEIEANTPYDEFARKVLTASGSNKSNPPASYFKTLRDPVGTMENTTHLFLAIRFNCNKCHDHPFERWTQDQYYSTAAYFARIDIKGDPASGGKNVGGTAVVGGKPLFEIVSDKNDGDVIHDRTNLKAAPEFPYPAKHATDPKAPRRQELADWMTSPDNAYFAKSYVNRVWGYLFGVGIIDPIDDIRAGNPPTNPELLDYLTKEFVKSGFNVRHLQKLIVTSRTYQLSFVDNKWNADDKTNYSHALMRRLPAETFYDSLIRATGSKAKLGRAAMLPDSGVDVPGGFLATFGRPARDSSCECERSAGMQMGPVMALVNGPTVAEAIGDPTSEIAKFVAAEKDDRKVIEELFLRFLGRPPQKDDVEKCLKAFAEVVPNHEALVAELKAKEADAAPLKAKRELARTDAMAKAKAELETHQMRIVGETAEREKQRQATIAKAQEAIKNYEAEFPKALAEWEKKQIASVEWFTLMPTKADGGKDVQLAIQPDRSIVAGGKNDNETYTIHYQTNLKHLSAIRLEALAIPGAKGPAAGPGRAKDGNFVVTGFEFYVLPKDSKELPRKHFLNVPKADFSQVNYDVRFALDDTGNRERGWAVSPAIGQTHWATFQIKNGVKLEPGSTIIVKVIHNFQQPSYNLARFRISFASSEEPVGLSLADDYQAIVSTPPASRTQAQKDMLAAFYRRIDPGVAERQKALAEAQKPLPVDPKLAELQATLADVSRPVTDDGKLVQLRADVAASTIQAANPRLTAAQDIAWALINNTGFMFIH